MKVPVSDQKKRGGYYTPKPIADFLCRWAIRTPTDRVLDPCCGDGEFLQSSAEVLVSYKSPKVDITRQVTGVEIEESEAKKARARLDGLGYKTDSNSVVLGDFFAFCQKFVVCSQIQSVTATELSSLPKYDVIVGNPPFIRYQYFPEEQRNIAFALMKQLGLNPTRLTNAWVPFVCTSILLLNPGGRLAMVIPVEILQVGYTAELRLFLSNNFGRVSIYTFKSLLFDGIQQEVVLLCAERSKDEPGGINVIELDNANDLTSDDLVSFDKASLKPMDHSTEKWTQYFLSVKEIELLRRIRNNNSIKTLGMCASVDVGVVTGMNNFFNLTNTQKRDLKLEDLTRQIVTRSAQLKGIRLLEKDWELQAEKNVPMNLLHLPSVPLGDLPKAVRTYIKQGEESGWDKGHKCMERKRWYSVPSVWIPDAFLLRQVYQFPKIVVNKTDATCTDTIHRIRLINGTKCDYLALSFLNSLTFAFAEILGRSYGGGVLELEPSEAERLPIPYEYGKNLDIDMVNNLIVNNKIYEVLSISDRVLLEEGLGLENSDVLALRGIWEKLSARRLNRR